MNAAVVVADPTGNETRLVAYVVPADQGLDVRRLREAMFLDGEPADTAERVLAVAARVEGLDLDAFARDLASPECTRSPQMLSCVVPFSRKRSPACFAQLL